LKGVGDLLYSNPERYQEEAIMFRINGPFHDLREIVIIYKFHKGLNSPFVQTYFDGSLASRAQQILKSPPPINRRTKQPHSAMNLYNLHIKQIIGALAKYEKDGGGISETKTSKVWTARFTVKDRQPRHVG